MSTRVCRSPSRDVRFHRYIGGNFTFGLLDCNRYIGDIVVPWIVKSGLDSWFHAFYCNFGQAKKCQSLMSGILLHRRSLYRSSTVSFPPPLPPPPTPALQQTASYLGASWLTQGKLSLPLCLRALAAENPNKRLVPQTCLTGIYFPFVGLPDSLSHQTRRKHKDQSDHSL